LGLEIRQRLFDTEEFEVHFFVVKYSNIFLCWNASEFMLTIHVFTCKVD